MPGEPHHRAVGRPGRVRPSRRGPGRCRDQPRPGPGRPAHGPARPSAPPAGRTRPGRHHRRSPTARTKSRSQKAAGNYLTPTFPVRPEHPDSIRTHRPADPLPRAGSIGMTLPRPDQALGQALPTAVPLFREHQPTPRPRALPHGHPSAAHRPLPHTGPRGSSRESADPQGSSREAFSHIGPPVVSPEASAPPAARWKAEHRLQPGTPMTSYSPRRRPQSGGRFRSPEQPAPATAAILSPNARTMLPLNARTRLSLATRANLPLVPTRRATLSPGPMRRLAQIPPPRRS
ncbi:hypothetical protein SAMN04489716_3966 [Actinoplanes derwentensis]|uniref:Uncharacterized protein n=1 Tax=Actinoplanes derwentensis TaxID=113562 RepID=A0A1H2ANX7_9ACTN|nr:hypothetical protein SAMN04489716_3966 [Actinoplanes derwentensis]